MSGLRKLDHDHEVDIYPNEASICQRLTDQVQSKEPLQAVLRSAVDAIQRHSKWFTQEGLEQLLQHALAKTSASDSTADLYNALDLLDVTCTFAALPRTCLEPVVKFISLSYYRGTRMHKHKSLAEKAWSLFQHVLDSHLGPLSTRALLDLLAKEEPLFSRASFFAVSGALRLLEEKFTFVESIAVSNLNITTSELLPSLRTIVQEGDDILKEQIIAILHLVLSTDSAVLDLEATASWNVLIELVEHCAIVPDNSAGHDLLDRISDVCYLLEPSQLEQLSSIFLEAKHRMPREVTEQVMRPIALVTRLFSNDDGHHDHLLETFSSQSENGDCLYKIMQQDCEFLASTDDRVQWTRLLQLYVDMLLEHNLSGEASTVCAAFVCTLLHLALRRSFDKARLWEVTIVFNAVTRLATSATRPEARLTAFRILARLRVSIDGHVYLEEDENADGPYANGTMPGVVMLSDLSRKLWLNEISALIQDPDDEQYQMTASFVLKSLPDQMRNLLFFVDQKSHVREVYDIAVHKLATANNAHAANYIQILTALINYRGLFSAAEERHMVDLFIKKAGSSEAVSKDCIHALTVCCHELPETVARDLDQVIQKMAQMITQKHLAIHVLEFLTGLSRLPNLFRNFRPDDFRKVFGVCISYLQSLRAGTMSRQSGAATSSDAASSSHQGAHEIMPQYVYSLAHHVIVFWYITLRPDDRQLIKAYVTNSLCYVQDGEKEMPDDQGMVVIDFMERNDIESTVQYGSGILGDGDADDIFDDVDGKLLIQHRICGMMLISTYTSLRTAKTLVETRRPSGTARYLVFGKSPISRESLTSTYVSPAPPSIWSGSAGEDDTITIYSDDADGSAYGTVSVPNATSPLGSSDIVTLPEDSALERAIDMFDRTPGLDSHKAGVIYIGEGQSDEITILANSSGSPDYREIVDQLGILRELNDAKFNTQGLSTTDGTDGTHAIVWNNDVTELVFHVTTMMPTDPDDIRGSAYSKKRHVGNDFVNIVFNNSGQPFRFDTLPSAFNYVYIVISPSVRTTFLQTRTHTMNTSDRNRFYRVEVVTRDDFPAISSAAEAKMISGASLPGYVRNLALNACVFSEVWVNRESDEYKSSWRTRLDQIRRLKDRHASTRTAPRKMSTSSKGKGKLQFWK